MLKILGQAAMAAVVVFLLAILALTAWRSYQQPHQTSHAASAEESKEWGNVAATESTEDAIARYNRWLVIFTGVLAIVAVVQIGVLIYANDTATKAANAAIKGNDLSRQTLVADQRPWISVTIEPAGPITWNDGGFQVSYKITLKNIGKSPALKVTHIEAIIIDRDANLVTQQAGLLKMLDAGINVGAANIMPGDGRQMIIHQQVDAQRVEKAAVPWTAAGGPKLITPVLIGTADYLTQFGTETYHTGFMFEIGFWDPTKGITVTALAPTSDGDIPAERVRIRRHPDSDGLVD